MQLKSNITSLKEVLILEGWYPGVILLSDACLFQVSKRRRVKMLLFRSPQLQARLHLRGA